MINTNIKSGSLIENKVLSQTYQLLSITIAFAGIMAFASMHVSFVLNPIVMLISYFGLLFLINKNQNNSSGIFFTFALTGLLGFTLGPLLNYTISMGNSSAIGTSMLGTGAILFLAAQIGKNKEKDFSSLGVFASIGLLIAFVVSLVNFFVFQASLLSIGISVVFLFLSSAIIVWQINNIVRGGETNYVLATVTLFVSIFNIFSSLLHILGFFGNDD